jgi:hypothetical protein
MNWAQPFAGSATCSVTLTRAAAAAGLVATSWISNIKVNYGQAFYKVEVDPAASIPDALGMRTAAFAALDDAARPMRASHDEYDDDMRVHARENVQRTMAMPELASTQDWSSKRRMPPLLASADAGASGGTAADGGPGAAAAAAARSDALVVHIGSWNCGNAAPPPPEMMDPWVPRGGRGADILVMCTQECTYDKDKAGAQAILGRLRVAAMDARGGGGDGGAAPPDAPRFLEISLEPPPPTKGKWKKQQARTTPIAPQVTEGGESVANWMTEDSPEQLDVLIKEEMYPFFQVVSSMRYVVVRLFAQVSGTFGSKDVLLAEGGQSLETWLNAQGTEEGSPECQLAFTLTPTGGGEDGVARLSLAYDQHVSTEQLHSQADFSEAAAAIVEGAQQSQHSTAEQEGTLDIHVASFTPSDGVAAESLQCRLTVESQTVQTAVAADAPAEGEATGVTWGEDFSLHVADHSKAMLRIEIVSVEEDAETSLGCASLMIAEHLESVGAEAPELVMTLESGGGVVALRVNWSTGPQMEMETAASTEEQAARDKAMEDSTHFFQTVKMAAGSQYYEVGREILWQIQMIVLARYDIQQDISGVEINTQKTGLVGGLVANKGGICFKLAYRGHELCFINTHLAAHEGLEHRQDRNRMAAEVQGGARVGNLLIDPANQFHHTFWAGDLNYRVEFSDWVGPDGSLDKTKAPHELKMRQVKRLIEHQKWDVLQAADELQREMAAGRVFAGFIDSPCDFPPTFKVERGYELQYNDKRVPSYCDRIIHCSKAGYERCLHQEAFNAGFNLITSDHKPVWGRYRISVPRDFTLRQSAAAQPSRVVCILGNIQLQGVEGYDPGLCKLFVHDHKLLFGGGVRSLQNLIGTETLCIPTRASSLEILQEDIESPSDGDQLTTISHGVVLRVVEDGAVLTTDLGYATLALRDSSETLTTVDEPHAHGIEATNKTALNDRVLRGPAFPMVTRQLSIPLSLNGVHKQGMLVAELVVAQTCTPLLEIVRETPLSLASQPGSSTVCMLTKGDKVMQVGVVLCLAASCRCS